VAAWEVLLNMLNAGAWVLFVRSPYLLVVFVCMSLWMDAGAECHRRGVPGGSARRVRQ
jgi:hypothetical protein